MYFSSWVKPGRLFNTLFVAVLTAVSVGRAQQLSLKDASGIAAQVPIGQGSGMMSVTDNSVLLEGTPTSFVKYSDNMTSTAAVFDYRLPHPVPLPAASDKVGVSYILNNAEKSNPDFQVGLRLLIQDARGGVWAVATRFGSSSDLAHVTGRTDLETYVLTTTELGRLDPWVMMSLDPKTYDDYDAPKAPYQLAGFRIITKGKENETFALRVVGLTGLTSGEFPAPYWSMSNEISWSIRLGQQDAPWGNYGWGANHAVPNLRPSDLGLDVGDYVYSWELLDTAGHATLAHQTGETSAKSRVDSFLEFPLLPPGTYHLYLGIRQKDETSFHNFYQTYVVFRDLGGKSAAAKKSEAPLTLDGLPGTTFRKGHFPVLTLQAKSLPPGKARIQWSVQAADMTELATDQQAADQPAHIDLEALSKAQTTLWLNTRLTVDGKDVDQIQRVVGTEDTTSIPPIAPSNPRIKTKELAGVFSRTKADWSEGSEPIVTHAHQIQIELGPWLQDTVAVGYNTIELPATWYELNPLPNVYQFQYLDKLIDMATKNHLSVTLRLHAIAGLMPPWISRDYQESQEGLAHGLWGGSNVLAPTACSQPYNEALVKFLTALSLHYSHNPTVLGYTLAGMFFDHDWLDSSWNAQYVDYSAAAKKGFAEKARQKYGTLARVGAAYGLTLKSWDEIPLPTPTPEFDRAGRLKPRTDALWRDYIAFKIGSMTESRLNEIRALRTGDPACWAGVYQTDSTAFYQKELRDLHVWLPCGSMESQFPITTIPEHGRYEPIGKIARTAELVDVGMTNILLQQEPGFNSFSNYWMFSWRMSTLEPAALDAENRLKTWFGVVDRLIGAKWVKDPNAGTKNGAYLVSYATQLNVLQHTFLGRFDDFLKPYVYRLGTDKLDVAQVHFDPGWEPKLDSHSYAYVPYCTMIMGHPMIKSLVDYVNRGGRLILEGTSGYWSETNEPNTLAGAFGLPEAVPQPVAASDSESGSWQPSAPFQGTPLAFRTREFLPPIEQQLTPWIQNIPRAFLRPYRFKGNPPPGAEVIARFADSQPAVLRLKQGKGEVLDFCGTIDWLGAPGLAAALDSWGRGQPAAQVAASDPMLLTQAMVKDGTDYVVGRRFINQTLIGKLIEGKHESPGPQALAVVLPQADSAVKSYHVRELLGGTDLGSLSPDTLTHQGVELTLAPGQAFILEATPVTP